MAEILKKIGWSVVSAVISAVVSIVLRKVFEVWGVLEPLSNWLGDWLRLHITAGQAGWSGASIIAIGCYGITLWFIWRRRSARRHGAEQTQQATPNPLPD